MKSFRYISVIIVLATVFNIYSLNIRYEMGQQLVVGSGETKVFKGDDIVTFMDLSKLIVQDDGILIIEGNAKIVFNDYSMFIASPTATITVKDSGNIQLRDMSESEIYTRDQKFTLIDNANLDLYYYSKINIKNGGEVVSTTADTIRFKGSSQLNIESGGSLTMKEASSVVLEDNSRCCVDSLGIFLFETKSTTLRVREFAKYRNFNGFKGRYDNNIGVRDSGVPNLKIVAKPNPFNPSTDIGFKLENSAKVVVDIFNVKGELVKRIANTHLNSGFHTFNFDASQFNSGVFYARVKVDGISQIKRIMLIK